MNGTTSIGIRPTAGQASASAEFRKFRKEFDAAETTRAAQAEAEAQQKREIAAKRLAVRRSLAFSQSDWNCPKFDFDKSGISSIPDVTSAKVADAIEKMFVAAWFEFRSSWTPTPDVPESFLKQVASNYSNAAWDQAATWASLVDYIESVLAECESDAGPRLEPVQTQTRTTALAPVAPKNPYREGTKQHKRWVTAKALEQKYASARQDRAARLDLIKDDRVQAKHDAQMEIDDKLFVAMFGAQITVNGKALPEPVQTRLTDYCRKNLLPLGFDYLTAENVRKAALKLYGDGIDLEPEEQRTVEVERASRQPQRADEFAAVIGMDHRRSASDPRTAR